MAFSGYRMRYDEASEPLLRDIPLALLINCRGCRSKETNAVSPHETWSGRNKDQDSDDPAHQLTSLKSQAFGTSSNNSSVIPKRQPAGLSQVLRMMQLDDYQIKPSEIEIMTNLDGSPATLGRGAFGEVISRFNDLM